MHGTRLFHSISVDKVTPAVLCKEQEPSVGATLTEDAKTREEVRSLVMRKGKERSQEQVGCGERWVVGRRWAVGRRWVAEGRWTLERK